MYLVGLHIYYKMIHGSYNVKFVHLVGLCTYCKMMHGAYNIKLAYRYMRYCCVATWPRGYRTDLADCVHSPAETVGANPAGSMDVCLLSEFSATSGHSSRVVLQTAVRRRVWFRNVKNEEDMTRVWPQSNRKFNQGNMKGVNLQVAGRVEDSRNHTVTVICF